MLDTTSRSNIDEANITPAKGETMHMSQVFVLNQHKEQQTPVHPAQARQLLSNQQAVVWRRFPFTIILKAEVATPELRPLRLKLDPGSKTTGIALVDDEQGRVVWAAELTHRGQQIRDVLLKRRAVRRSRRQRKTRYRKPRFLNRTRPAGWLAPSLESRVRNIETWVVRLRQLAPIGTISLELVRFDTQLMQNAEISGVEYQQGELMGYEVRQYLLEKWGRKCAYCGMTDTPLQVEHINPRARGGSDRVSNLTLACEACNQRKGTQTAAEFGFTDIQAKAKAPLKDAAAVNTTRWAIYERLKATGLAVEVGTGGRTKFNRLRLNLPKMHWLDATCVGASTPNTVSTRGVRPLLIRAMGHGSRQMCGTNASGFPIRHRSRIKRHYGFQTGDIVRAVVPTGKFTGVHVGRITVRNRPSFVLNGKDVHQKYLTTVHQADGYTYALVTSLTP